MKVNSETAAAVALSNWLAETRLSDWIIAVATGAMALSAVATLVATCRFQALVAPPLTRDRKRAILIYRRWGPSRRQGLIEVSGLSGCEGTPTPPGVYVSRESEESEKFSSSPFIVKREPVPGWAEHN